MEYRKNISSLIIASMIIFGIISFMMCGCKYEVKLSEINTTVEDLIIEYIDANSESEKIYVDISELTDFEWDVMFLYRYDITREEVNEALGINYEGPLDAYEGLIFLKDNKFVYHETLREDENSESLIQINLIIGSHFMKKKGIKFTVSNDVFIGHYDESKYNLNIILYKGDEAEGGKCGDTQLEEANKLSGQANIEQLINAINNKNSDDIKKLLSPVLTEKKSTDKEVEYLIEMLDGEIIESKEVYAKHYPEYILDEPRCVWEYRYTVSTKDSEYVLIVGYLPQDVTELNNTGIYSVRLMDYLPEDEKYELYYFNYLITGIFPSTTAGVEANTKILTEYIEIPSDLSEYWPKERVAGIVAPQIGALGINAIEKITVEVFESTEFDCGYLEIYVTDSVGDDYVISVGFNYSGLIQYVKNITTGEVLLEFY